MNRLVLALVCTLATSAGCAHSVDKEVTREVARPDGLTYTMQVDATRLEHGSGLGPLAAVTGLVEEDLAAFFRERPSTTQGATRREIVAEAPAPGYGVHVVIEARPDDYCVVVLDIVRWKDDGSMETVKLAPYSVQFGVRAIRDALSALRNTRRPPLTLERFDSLRAQATELARQNADPPLDETNFARAPRSLSGSDEARYYAPPTDNAGRDLRGHAGDE
ncbi:MAG: hypothetical protein ABI321_00965 [Polyangia bacterium]